MHSCHMLLLPANLNLGEWKAGCMLGFFNGQIRHTYLPQGKGRNCLSAQPIQLSSLMFSGLAKSLYALRQQGCKGEEFAWAFQASVAQT